MADWRRSLLKSIGAPVTPANLRFLANWQRWEGGHTNNDARFNWLNTTRGPGRSINSVGVKAFDSFQTGIRYTAETLMNGRYDDIVGSLRGGNPYKSGDMSRGLQVWVSGRPDGNPEYARKVMGQKAGAGGVPFAPSSPAPSIPGPPKPPPLPALPDSFLRDVWGDMTPLFKRISKRFGQQPPAASPAVRQPGHAAGRPAPDAANGKGLMIPGTIHGTHVTDGLGWGTRTAEDIMSSPGTAVQAPGAGRVVYWHPTGAQGGGSMLIRLDNGREYWLGHIADGVRPGTRFRRGDTLARISSDHPRPHLHVDSR